jgi:hypothetical protein
VWEIIEIYYTKKKFVCVITKPTPPPVDTKLSYIGRQTELSLLLNCAKCNIGNYLNGIRTKQNYHINIVHGGVGVGKSRLIVEANNKLKNSNQWSWNIQGKCNIL